MAAKLLSLASKIRFELLSASKKTPYATNIFRYFNAVYAELDTNRALLLNPAGELKNKSDFSKANNPAINGMFEQVFSTLSNQTAIDRNASSDFMTLYALGFEVQYQMGDLIAKDKTEFFKRLIELYNHDFNSNFTSLEDFVLNKKSRRDYEDSSDY